ncbi:galactokinase, partial [Nocardioides sp.]|uniref:galactokinase n=1 Tax=Nocardioides sp. TaxID=35761 RepID=UPI0035637B9E
TPGTVPGWAGYVVGVLRAMQEAGHPVPGVEIHLDGRVPLGAGLSSSAALECSVAVAVCGLLGVDLSPDVRRELVAICIRAEGEFVGAPTGGMDQTVSLLADEGSALLVDFADHTTSHVPLPLAERGLALLVTDTTVSHALAAEGGGGYGRRRRECAEAARRLGVETLRHADPARVEELSEDRLRRRARHVVTEIERVRRVVDATRAGDWQDVGVLLSESHRSMRDDFEISTPELDLAVASAMSAGALGARMTGGGFGGSSVALVEADRVPEIAAAISVDFARAGHAPPVHLVAAPSAGADLTAG